MMCAAKAEVLGSYWTLAGGAYPHTDREYSPFDFRERVEAASRAGFTGLGFWHADLAHILETRKLPEMKRILDDNGIVHVELEFIYDWFLDGEKKQKSDELKLLLLSAAEALEARHVKVGDFFKTPCPMPRLIERFAALCGEAEDYGTRILFEMMPFANPGTLDGTIELVTGAGAKNGGVILDLWHIVRMGLRYDELRKIPARYLMGVELNDGDLELKGELHQETIDNRKLLGEGEFDVRGFVAAMKSMGFHGPWGIEVLNKDMREWPLQKLMERTWETTVAHLAD
jgi:sugar phosphate isomerase/epimerase